MIGWLRGGGLGGGWLRNGGLDDAGRNGGVWGGGLKNALATEAAGGGGGGLVEVVGGGLDGGAHLADDFGVVGLLLARDHVGKIAGIGLIEHVGSVVGFGVKFVTHGGAAGLDGATFGVDETGEKREAMAGFFFGDVANTGRLDLFRGGDEDGGFALARHPEAFLGLEVVGEDGGEVGFHGLVFLDGEGEDEKKEAERNRDDGKEGENLEEAYGKHDGAKNHHEINKLSKSERTEKLVLCLDILRDLIVCHEFILS